MKTMKRKGLLLFAGLWSVFISLAQSANEEKKEPAQVKLSANYNSNLNYYGRTDSLRSSGFFPLAELWFNKNFYINAAPVFVNNKVSSFSYAGTVSSLGYQFNSENNKWGGNFYFLKPFYKESSQLVQSALKSQAGMMLSRMSSVLNITGGVDLKFSDKTDWGVLASLDHVFRSQLSEKSVLVIDPTATLNAGTQQFTKSYLKKTPGSLLVPGNEQLISESVKKFSILSYEFSMPVIFAAGKFQWILTPAYVLPKNLITIENRPDLSERGKDMFYMTVGMKIAL